MMLDREQTKINIEEQVVYEQTWTDRHTETSVMWQANLDGESIDGEAVRMSRSGGTPDEALKNLFEAMTKAQVTL